MIVNKFTKTFQTRSDKPNSNWLDDNWYCVDDNSVLANKIVSLYPRFELVVENDKLINVIELHKTKEELDLEHKQEIKERLEELDKKINRATEDLYEITNSTPYIATQEIIAEKIALREELKTLGGASSGTEDTINK